MMNLNLITTFFFCVLSLTESLPQRKNQLSARWGYDKNASPHYRNPRNNEQGDDMVVDDRVTEMPRNANRHYLKLGVNARMRQRPRANEEDEYADLPPECAREWLRQRKIRRPRGRSEDLPPVSVDPISVPRRRRRPSKCARSKHRLSVADSCFPDPELLQKEVNMPDTSDIHVVVIDDPMVIVVPDCGQTKVTTCASNVEGE